MQNYRASLGFVRLSDAALSEFAANVVLMMTGNQSYPTPLVPLLSLGAEQADYQAGILEAKNGGPVAKAAKNALRVSLMEMLRQEASYVQSIAGSDLSVLLSSGFKAVSTNRARIALPAPVVERIDNPTSGQLGVRLKPVPTAHAYEVRVSYGTNGWETKGVFTDSRKIVVSDLTPGMLYNVQSRAVGGTTGYSGWSDPISRRVL